MQLVVSSQLILQFGGMDYRNLRRDTTRLNECKCHVKSDKIREISSFNMFVPTTHRDTF